MQYCSSVLNDGLQINESPRRKNKHAEWLTAAAPIVPGISAANWRDWTDFSGSLRSGLSPVGM